MKAIIGAIAIALLAASPAAAGSAKSLAPGQQEKGAHGYPGHSYWAPGQQKKAGQSARKYAPGYKKNHPSTTGQHSR